MTEPTIGKVVQDAKEVAPDWLYLGQGMWMKYRGTIWTDLEGNWTVIDGMDP